jgi:hypothetical protein
VRSRKRGVDVMGSYCTGRRRRASTKLHQSKKNAVLDMERELQERGLGCLAHATCNLHMKHGNFPGDPTSHVGGGPWQAMHQLACGAVRHHLPTSISTATRRVANHASISVAGIPSPIPSPEGVLDSTPLSPASSQRALYRGRRCPAEAQAPSPR